MTEIPDHLLKRAQEAKDRAAGKPVAPSEPISAPGEEQVSRELALESILKHLTDHIGYQHKQAIKMLLPVNLPHVPVESIIEAEDLTTVVAVYQHHAAQNYAILAKAHQRSSWAYLALAILAGLLAIAVLGGFIL